MIEGDRNVSVERGSDRPRTSCYRKRCNVLITYMFVGIC